jgi:hypothetical protein
LALEPWSKPLSFTSGSYWPDELQNVTAANGVQGDPAFGVVLLEEDNSNDVISDILKVYTFFIDWPFGCQQEDAATTTEVNMAELDPALGPVVLEEEDSSVTITEANKDAQEFFSTFMDSLKDPNPSK